eukprot:CAMPEP_0198318822 /NCGR_PEP_ID=MMETSP1450-20131203/8101_1 /TAXON_ID=753684 ORGANISM="Madagascaria erythrocladiodes, Strain CCMP3234" /NCGR_SAMPLE_ID=MMETSP1450 /ASSEMBLY_ACC=CAM_ASM_001115 /LENGTH=562 /DNA_ID=CAMNT_0044022163 /DNA_START=177 /DNA_END=1865 /DNA_ORIENTATION=+
MSPLPWVTLAAALAMLVAVDARSWKQLQPISFGVQGDQFARIAKASPDGTTIIASTGGNSSYDNGGDRLHIFTRNAENEYVPGQVIDIAAVTREKMENNLAFANSAFFVTMADDLSVLWSSNRGGTWVEPMRLELPKRMHYLGGDITMAEGNLLLCGTRTETKYFGGVIGWYEESTRAGTWSLRQTLELRGEFNATYGALGRQMAVTPASDVMVTYGAELASEEFEALALLVFEKESGGAWREDPTVVPFAGLSREPRLSISSSGDVICAYTDERLVVYEKSGAEWKVVFQRIDEDVNGTGSIRPVQDAAAFFEDDGVVELFHIVDRRCVHSVVKRDDGWEDDVAFCEPTATSFDGMLISGSNVLIKDPSEAFLRVYGCETCTGGGVTMTTPPTSPQPTGPTPSPPLTGGGDGDGNGNGDGDGDGRGEGEGDDDDGGSSGVSAGAIAGGVIGGIVGLLVIGGLVLFLLKRRNGGSSSPDSDPGQQDTQGFYDSGHGSFPSDGVQRLGTTNLSTDLDASSGAPVAPSVPSTSQTTLTIAQAPLSDTYSRSEPYAPVDHSTMPF